MRDPATDRRGATFLVLLIVRLLRSTPEGSLHTYLPDGSMHCLI